ncbi:arylsulfatase [Shimia thalassica]|uniref:arylsulfatase n=1 Tax=Shimia thalassica TaxID=1715693 RepID=UPI0026E16DB3|nr:arylsulfatase [Shimia thalassica]MDO6519963.1 arylsulfatase [Shimia thalassica]MDP2578763.1 arylsulfatase [Shimia thalassica]
MFFSLKPMCTAVALVCSSVLVNDAWAQDAPPPASKLSRAVAQNDYMQPAIPRPEQDALAAEKLAAFEAKTGKKPNILIFIVDDMGFGDPGVYGGGEVIGAATPHIDDLAAEGLRLTSTYSQYTCTPTRAAIYTGRLPMRTGLIRPILAGDNIKQNPWEGELSVAGLLSDAGYHTMLVGKWHIGEGEGMRPHDVGFDEFYGFYKAQKEYTQDVYQMRFPDLVLDEDKLARYHSIGSDNNLIFGQKDGTTQVIENIDSIEKMAEGDKMLRDYTLKRLEELAQGDKPFYLSHSFMKLHADNFPSKEFVGKSASKFPYRDNLVEVDAYVGDIMAKLETLGLLEETFVFFTSDNGPQMDSWPDSGYTPFRGAKGTTWEGGVRVPGIAYWKGMIEPGRTSDGLFDLMDLFNTSLTLGGVSFADLPNDRYYDGVDQTSFLLAENGESLREHVYNWLGSKLTAMRMREYKAHLFVAMAQEKFLWIDMATVVPTGLAPWLFNLYVDPKEEYPVGHRMNAWTASLGAELKAHAATFKKFPPKDLGL